jgi:hypothetical protein
VLSRLITHFERRRILRLHFAPIVDSSCRNIGVAEPFLHLGDVGFMVEGVRGGRGAQGVGVALERSGRRGGFHVLISRMAHRSRAAPDSTCPSGKVTWYPSSPSQGFKTDSNPPWLVNFCSLGSWVPVVRNIQAGGAYATIVEHEAEARLDSHRARTALFFADVLI